MAAVAEPSCSAAADPHQPPLPLAPAPPTEQLRDLGPGSPKSVTLAQRRRGEFPPTRDIPTPDVRLYHRAVVVAQDVQGQLRGLVRQLSIDQFENESRRVSMGAGASEASTVRNKTPLFERTFSEPVREALGAGMGRGRGACC